ncbi:unnamed protein product [Paramecium sonneborni]|uniref:Transmembrane protein n=1 Tax=Paramecium sonneborni TaxID=65129 RepID=A0A8S1R1Z7_9CILI|nr:unnamed protein product [Paramecium sonneborni]
MFQLYTLFIIITISLASTIKLKNPIQVDYYNGKLNQIFLDQNHQLWFEFVKSIEILNPKETICKSIPYQFEPENPITIPFQNITSTLYNNGLKTLFVLEQKQLTLIQFLFTNFSISPYHFRNGQSNQINRIEAQSYDIQDGIALAQIEENLIVLLNTNSKLILFDLNTKSFVDLQQFQTQPIWITSANHFLFVGFQDKLIQYSLKDKMLIEINHLDIFLQDTSILMVELNNIYIKFPLFKVIKITYSLNILKFEDYLNENKEIISLSLSGEKISYLTNDNVFINSDLKLFEQYDKFLQFDDVIILISKGGVHKIISEFTDEISLPLYIKHQNVSDAHFMNNFGINYHIITRSEKLIQINEIQFIESFIECDDRIQHNEEDVYFIAQADKCFDKKKTSSFANCKFEGKIQFNKISIFYSKFSDLAYLMILVLMLSIILIILAIYLTRKFQRQAELYTVTQKVITNEDQSQDQINQEKEC